MPSPDHEVLIELIRSDPSLLRSLLASLGVTIAGGEAEVRDTTLTVPELRADLVVAVGNQQSPDVVLIAEIQLREDADKLYSMPFYAISARSRYRCPAMVVVIALNEAVAAWARTGRLRLLSEPRRRAWRVLCRRGSRAAGARRE